MPVIDEDMEEENTLRYTETGVPSLFIFFVFSLKGVIRTMYSCIY